jgi:hypothetical protein
MDPCVAVPLISGGVKRLCANSSGTLLLARPERGAENVKKKGEEGRKGKKQQRKEEEREGKQQNKNTVETHKKTTKLLEDVCGTWGGAEKTGLGAYGASA